MGGNSALGYEFRTDPYQHQREVFEDTWDREYFAIFWEPGTGKTKLILDTASLLRLEGEIECLFVLAPNGVHRNWVVEEISKHVPEAILKDTMSFSYQTSKAKTKRHKLAAQRVIDHDGFTIVAQSYDGFVTKEGKKFAQKVLKGRRCLYVLDESSRIKTPKATRTVTVLNSSKFGKYRRILTGTPVTNGPFDIYSQMRFLDPNFWKPHGLGSYFLFKNYFANWQKGYDSNTGREFPILVNYKNLEELHDIIQPFSSRVTKEDVLDLPPKLYNKRFFDMGKEQSRMYREIKEDYATMTEDGDLISAEMALTRLLRLQQITCGYVPVEHFVQDEDDPFFMKTIKEVKMIDLPKKNGRLKLLLEVLDDLSHKAIVWARFTPDIDMICDALGDNCVRYDGKTTDDQRLAAIKGFQDDPDGPQFFIGNARAAGIGITLTAAKTVVYYNNTFVLEDRLQSEDRPHRIGQDTAVNYIDIVANDTVDDHIIDALRDKLDVANMVNGDRVKEWI